MIISSLSDDKILEELLFDKKIVAKEAKKIARKQIIRLQKGGRDGINENLDFTYDIRVRQSNNLWRLIVVINMAKRVKWCHYAACYTESEHGTKDYYLVRGFSDEKPYFIKLSSHVLKRFRERAIEDRFGICEPFNGNDFVPLIFRMGETITWMKIVDPKYWKIIYGSDSEEQNVLTNLYYTFYGVYLGYETEHGNYVFKTFLNNDKKLKKMEETEIMKYCYFAHVGFNESFYDSKFVERLKAEGLDNITDYFDFKLLP